MADLAQWWWRINGFEIIIVLVIVGIFALAFFVTWLAEKLREKS